MDDPIKFYICPSCFQISEIEAECHGQPAIVCNAGRPGAANRRPLANHYGEYVSRAPRWYLEARSFIPAWSPLPNDFP